MILISDGAKIKDMMIEPRDVIDNKEVKHVISQIYIHNKEALASSTNSFRITFIDTSNKYNEVAIKDVNDNLIKRITPFSTKRYKNWTAFPRFRIYEPIGPF